jgi:hypothetical protein
VGAPATGMTPACSPCRGEHHSGGGLTFGKPERRRCRASVSRGGASQRRDGSGHLAAMRAAPPHHGHVARAGRTCRVEMAD